MRFDELRLGMVAEVSKSVGVADIETFAELVQDSNPLHSDTEFAASSRFGGVIAHGMLTAGLLSTLVGMKLPGTGGIYISQTLNFRGPVRPGDTITAHAEVVELVPERKRVRLATRITNQRNETVLDGEAWMLLME